MHFPRYLALSLTAALVGIGACTQTSGDAEDTGRVQDGLKRLDHVDEGREVRPLKPLHPIQPSQPGRPGVLAPPSLSTYVPVPACSLTRFDVRRLTRSCEDLPGAVVEGGNTYVPGEGGRFKVERPLANTTAPASLQQKTCSYVWEPAACGAPPDTARLLLEEPDPSDVEKPFEQLVPRRPGCEQLGPGGCDVKTPAPAIDGGIPTGLGRCEVCGFVSGNHLWAVLPADWKSFSYRAGDVRKSVQLTSSQEFYEVELPTFVADQNVTIYQYDSAPE